MVNDSFWRFSLVAIGILTIGTGPSAGESPDARPNVLLIYIDTLRADHLSSYDYTKPTSPAIDRLAAEGVRFETAYAPTSTTGPSTVSLFTSLYPATHGYLENGPRLALEFTTLAERFQAAGYQTSAVVSSAVVGRPAQMLQGFDYVNDKWSLVKSSDFIHPTTGKRAWIKYDRRAEYSVEVMAKWFENQRVSDTPFFAFLHLMDPHEPYEPPEPFRSEWVPDEASLDHQERVQKLYDADIAYADHHIGTLLDLLEKSGLSESTVVVITADHGQSLNEHGWLGHALQIYDESVRIPLIIRYPREIVPGTVIAGPALLLDVTPTLLGYAGIAPESAEFAGQDLRPFIEGAAEIPADRAVFLQRQRFPEGKGFLTEVVRGEKFGVLRYPWKYIEAPEQESYELFDLRNDPGELENVHANFPETAAELAGTLRAFRTEFGKPPAQEAEVPSENEEALRALGYID